VLILSIFLEGDGMLEDLTPEEKRTMVHLTADSDPMRVGVLARGLESGRPSVGLAFKLPDNRWVLAETSVRLFLAAAKAIEARYGEAALHERQYQS
jgi:hypothetical protein